MIVAGGGGGGFGMNRACNVNDAKQVVAQVKQMQLNRAVLANVKGIKVVKVRLCADLKAKVVHAVIASKKVQVLQRVLGGSSKMVAELQRSGAGVGNIYAVGRSGAQLTVYSF